MELVCKDKENMKKEVKNTVGFLNEREDFLKSKKTGEEYFNEYNFNKNNKVINAPRKKTLNFWNRIRTAKLEL